MISAPAINRVRALKPMSHSMRQMSWQERISLIEAAGEQ
jgi:hypothetical protein